MSMCICIESAKWCAKDGHVSYVETFLRVLRAKIFALAIRAYVLNKRYAMRALIAKITYMRQISYMLYMPKN